MVLWTQNPQTFLKQRDPAPITLDCGGCDRTRALSQADLGSKSGSTSICVCVCVCVCVYMTLKPLETVFSSIK